MKNSRKKKIVEIYFILYLAALVLLIPGKDNGSSSEHKPEIRQRIFQLPFSLKPEKNALNATVKLDSTGITILAMDSVNTIFYTGQVKNIKFDVSVEDRNSRQVLALDNQSSSDFFRYLSNEATQTLKFVWDPPLYDRKSKTYIVKIKASAISTETDNVGLILEDEVQFSLNLNYITDFNSAILIAADATDNSEIRQENTLTSENRNLILSRSNMFLSPREDIVRSIAYTTWENEISIFGLDPKIDLRKQPLIKIIREPDNRIGGSAKITGFTDAGLLISGDTPGFGSMKVQVSITRHADGKEAMREFRVQPQLIDEPNIETKIYPDIKYKFDPKLPVLSGQKTYASLKTQDGKVYASSETGGEFSIIPSINDTGKVLYFERFVDDKIIGQRVAVNISMYPKPEITRVSETGKNTLRIMTNCYGVHNKRENYIAKINILPGSNAKVREIFGAQKNEDGTFIFKQVFEITPLNSGSDFKFQVQAEAINGQKSDILNYP
ncbi:MAG: hypothetical protein KIT33_11720 [Candidatus Kapabacteria bacterium]|nr:hypothetical protein [Ignavibacteriota bacterium]MCW5885628.1 hypothetical protein [Candidatus Kapabacteria bacterium]